MNATEFVAQTGSLPDRRLATCEPLPAKSRPADFKSEIRQSPTLRPRRLCGCLCGWLALVLWCFAFAGQVVAQSTATTTAAHFRPVDVFVDSKDQPLAAYQLEFAVTNGSAKIIGIEGGEHAAFAKPPFYDPAAMQHERVIIAAFSTEPADKLPSGKTRVATIHIQTTGKSEPGFVTKLQTTAGPEGKKITAEASVEERKSQ